MRWWISFAAANSGVDLLVIGLFRLPVLPTNGTLSIAQLSGALIPVATALPSSLGSRVTKGKDGLLLLVIQFRIAENLLVHVSLW